MQIMYSTSYYDFICQNAKKQKWVRRHNIVPFSFLQCKWSSFTDRKVVQEFPFTK